LKVLFGISVAYAFALLVWGTYLAYKIRKVPISIYDESKVIAFSIYNTCFFGIIVIVIQLAIGNSNRYLTFMITAVCCFLGAMVTTGCLFGAKLFAIYRPGKEYRSSGTMGTSSSGDSRSKPGSASTGSIARESSYDHRGQKYRKKYKALKARSKDQAERIRQLETLAKAHGFLDAADVEMAERSADSKEGSKESNSKESRNSRTSKAGKSSESSAATSSAAINNDKFAPKAPENDMESSSEESSD
jgi:hypothetical protein